MLANLFRANEKDVTIALLATVAVCIVDLRAPLWYDAWVLYLIPMFFMFRSAKRPYIFSAVITLLTIGDLFFHQNGEPFMHSAINRATGVFGGWGVSVLLMRLKRLHDKLYESQEERYRSLFENMLEGFAYCRMLYVDKRPYDFVYLHVNDAFEKLTGLKDVVGKRVTELIPGVRETYPELFETYGRVAMTGKPERFEIYMKPVAAWLSISVYSTEKEHFTAVFEDITDRKKNEEKLRSQSLTDELTGLYNRRGFLNLAEKLGRMAIRHKKGLYMLYADLDGLKKINDTLGHKEGDAALVEMASILRTTYRESDIIARIGGDEFVVFPVGASGEDIETAVTRLQHNVEARNANRKKGNRLSISCGLSYYDPAYPASIEELLEDADRLMYERKKGARMAENRLAEVEEE